MSHIFPGQDDSEVIQKIIYKHIFAILPFLFVSIALFIIGLFVVYLAAAGIKVIPDNSFSSLIPNMGVPGTTAGTGPATTISIPWLQIGFILSGLGAFMLFTTLYIWRQNRLILTSENVVDIDQHGLFHKDISTLRLSRVQDITVVVKGPIQTMLHYGTITIQTAGEQEHFEFDYISRPYEAKKYIVDLFEEFVEGTGKTETEGDSVTRAASPAGTKPTQGPVVTDQTGGTFPIPPAE